MDSNYTTNQSFTFPSPSLTTIIVSQICSIVFGLVGFLLSGFISISLLLKSVELRQGQQHILLTTMEIANFSLTFTYFLASCFRLKYVMTGESLMNVSAWECMKRIYSPMFTFTFPFVTTTLFANACERFIAVAFPIFYYHKVKTKHQFFVALFVVAYCSLATVVAYVSSYNLDQTPIWPYACLTVSAVGKSYTTYYYTHSFIFVMTSALISLATVLTLRRKSKVGDNNSNSLPSVYLKKQKSLTNTMVLTTAVVFVLMCPAVISYFVSSALHIASVQLVELVIPYSSLIFASHNIVSDIILCFMNRQVSGSVKRLCQAIIVRLKKMRFGQTTAVDRVQVDNNL